MKALAAFILLYLALACGALGQEYSYTQYGTREGLAGSTVYCLANDKDGFLWLGTEAGLSRFDGTKFKTFTKQDGLPDNEIIQLFTDSKGRLWIAPFKNAICYYYRGKIYNAENDSLVKKIAIGSVVVRFAEDKKGNILLLERNRLHLLRSNGEITTYSHFGGQPFRNGSAVSRNQADNFLVFADNKAFELVPGTEPAEKFGYGYSSDPPQLVACSENMLICRTGMTEARATSFLSGKSFPFFYAHTHLNFIIVDKRHFARCTTGGVTIYDVENPADSQNYLQGIPVSHVLRDAENSLWFSTLGQGVYRLNSEFVYNVSLNEGKLPSLPVVSLDTLNNEVIAGTNNWVVYGFSPATGKLKERFTRYIDSNHYSPVTGFARMDNGDLVIASTTGITRVSPAFTIVRQHKHVPVKALCRFSDDLLAATTQNVLLVDAVSLAVKDTLFRTRATTVFNANDTIYIGTLNGLYCIYPDKSIKYLGEISPLFKNRVTSMRQSSDGVIWIAMYDEGVIGWKDNKVQSRITVENGLSSNMCYSIYLHDIYLWVGTNKGVNKIDISKKNFPLQKYSTGDGLLSDIINAIYIEGSKVYLGTPEGLTWFDEQRISNQSRCDLQVTSILSGNRTYEFNNGVIVLPHMQNDIRVDYAGISFKSAGDIRYLYRLEGLDTAWKETRETYLSYPALPSGNYDLQLQAINKFGNRSNMASVRFTIEQPFWEKTWFRILLTLVFFGAVTLLVVLISQRIKKTEERKTATTRRISELEQLALKAQMNPHFIFNSLNSIQQFVMDKDIAGANRFISRFSRLIRQTLDFSSKSLISLESEISYLSTYLELEQIRFENKFSYSIVTGPGVYPSELYVPPMVLQPYIENSIRHGIRYRKDNNGKIAVAINLVENHLVCVLEDNGIGRKAAGALKSQLAIEYQSRGMSLTADRIALLNKDSSEKIIVWVDDMEDENGNSLGTRVTVSFPTGFSK